MIINKSIRKTLSILPGLLLLGSALVQPLQASALTGSNFNAGHIIDDVVFTNSNSMTVGQIQSFLNAKVGSCDNNGTGLTSSGATRAAYDASIGKNTKFTCINQYYENPSTHANNLDGNPIPSGGVSAAQIIYNAAQQNQINPEVILTTLQKEQGLVADTWPWDSEYTDAMGYGCPASGCQSQYAGFYNQVSNAAWQFHQYMINPNGFNHVVGNNNISYSAGTYTNYNNGVYTYVAGQTPISCPSSTVYIQNEATAALYNYTPYQPDTAALSGLSDSSTGGTDACGSYGNRNFWWYFNEWFGSSIAPSYSAAYYTESAYPTISQGQSASVIISYQNLGNMPWYDSTDASANGAYPVVLATMNPTNRVSNFYDPSWASGSRPATQFTHVYNSDGVTPASNQHIVEPGQVAQYIVTMTAPSTLTPGTYQEYFSPIMEGAPNWYLGLNSVYMQVTVNNAYQAAYSQESSYPTLTQNSSTNGFFTWKNTGSSTWYDSTDAAANNQVPVELSTLSLGRSSAFSTGWPSSSVASTQFAAVYNSDGTTPASNQHEVLPGQFAKFSFPLTATLNTSPGSYQEWFQLIRPGISAYQVVGSYSYLNVTVQPSTFSAKYSMQSTYPTLSSGQSSSMYFSFVNSGNSPWYDDSSATPGILPVHLATTAPINRSDIFSAGWPSVSRPDLQFTHVYESDGITPAPNQHIVQPGEIAQFSFPVTAPNPAVSGVYKEYFQPVLEGAPGSLWNLGIAAWENITVQ